MPSGVTSKRLFDKPVSPCAPARKNASLQTSKSWGVEIERARCPFGGEEPDRGEVARVEQRPALLQREQPRRDRGAGLDPAEVCVLEPQRFEQSGAQFGDDILAGCRRDRLAEEDGVDAAVGDAGSRLEQERTIPHDRQDLARCEPPLEVVEHERLELTGVRVRRSAFPV